MEQEVAISRVQVRRLRLPFQSDPKGGIGLLVSPQTLKSEAPKTGTPSILRINLETGLGSLKSLSDRPTEIL